VLNNFDLKCSILKELYNRRLTVNSLNIGDKVVIVCNQNRFHGEGALVVSEPYRVSEEIELVTVKVFYHDWEIGGGGEWKECFMIIDSVFLMPDTEWKFEGKRIEIKFPGCHHVSFLRNPINFESECHICNCAARVRIDVNIWGTIYQYDVCRECAKEWDGKRTDGLPEKKREAAANA